MALSSQGRKRLIAVVALGIAAGSLGFVVYGGMEDNLVYYWNVDELLDQGAKAHGLRVRLGGVVKAGSYTWDEKSLRLGFGIVKEAGSAQAVSVQAKGLPPQMFREGIGVLVEGAFDGTIFSADRVIVKHSNEYQVPQSGGAVQAKVN